MTAEHPIVAFLKARLDEDEQAAHSATQGPWTVGESDTNGGYEIYSEESGVAVQGHYGGGVVNRADAEHIARHDPARVLREVEVKRRIVAKYAGLDADPNRLTYAFAQQQWAALRAVVAALALPYSDDEDYDPAWSI